MSKPKQLLIASNNRSKSHEIMTILNAGLQDLGVQILLLADFPDAQEIEETGSTYAENASIKSKAGAQQTGLISLGDDVGLEIDAMDGQPGLYSRRFAGEETPFSEKIKIILERLKDIPEERRGARFRAAVAVSIPGGETKVFEAKREGRIDYEPKGANGFGYDPIFFLPDMGCTMAELDPAVKNQTSHRAKVLSEVIPYLRILFA